MQHATGAECRAVLTTESLTLIWKGVQVHVSMLFMCICCRAQAAADREWRIKEKAAIARKAAVQADLNEARGRQAADRAAAAAAAAEAARRDAAAQSASAQHALAAEERQVQPGR